MRRIVIAVLLCFGCSAAAEHEDHESCEPPLASVSESLSSIDCSESSDTGYDKGNPFPITVVTVDGKPVEKQTANAYYVMAQAAAAAGVNLKVVSGFRTMAEQQYLYNCYINCSCNNCNLAAKPGYSNHQSGHALDLNTSSGGVYAWLEANAAKYGFKRTVSSEPWHWEWWGGGPGGGPCNCQPTGCNGTKLVSGCGEGDCAAYGATCVHDGLGPRCVSVFCPAQGKTKVCLNDELIGDCNDGAISSGDCSVFGASCVQDELGARCVSVFCPAQGKTKTCLDDSTILDCENGGITGSGDCGAYGAFCSTAGASEARCVSVFCVASPDDVPQAHDVCLPNGQLAHCDDAGGITAEDCPASAPCSEGACGGSAAGSGGTSSGSGGAGGDPGAGGSGWSGAGAGSAAAGGAGSADAGGDAVDGSCACALPGAPRPLGHAPLALLAALAVVARRRRA